ncbi:SacI homology domain-containing protein [Syncephalis fuscata]|nr:SacI homology domain-containing protein [Syncephalis fuscata]
MDYDEYHYRKHLYNNNDFLWNTFLLQMLSAMSGGKLDPSLQLQVIRGFVGQKQLLHDTELTVISRMSRHRAGTRFLQRGADHTGATAITVETEMIVSTPSHAAGWSVLRGSIPLQWQQPMTDIRRHPRAKLLNTLPSSSPPSSHDKAMHEQSMTTTATTTPVQRLDVVDTVTASSPSTTTIPTAFSNEAFEAFRQHVKWIQARHGPSVTFANLIRDHDCTEALLSNAFRLMVHYADMPNVAYLSTPVLRRSGSLYDAAASAYSYASRSGFTVMDTTQLNKSSNESVNTVPHILRKQQGCLRVNCMDCLDRTGLVQFRVAMLMLPQMLTAVERSVDNVDISRAMRSLWANNNDALAQQYTGSGAVAGWLVRHGGRCHLLRQLYDTQTLIARAYINTLVDPKRQRLIDTWHGLNTTTATATIALSLNDQVIFDIKSTIPLDKDQVTANRLLDALLRLHQRIGPIAIKHVYQFLAGLFWICLITLFVNLFSFSKSATSTSSTFTETTSSNTITNNTNTSTNTREKRRIIRQA